ncbi:hypothetical protein [Rhodovulum sp. YEN HP10]|uniref:hypothetical protein n=1 Tax=Rhodovulum sp. HP10 TaxID=3387397 RepID=UPI0039E0DFE9
MRGDTGTILPEGLHHPAHWPAPDPPERPQEQNSKEFFKPNGSTKGGADPTAFPATRYTPPAEFTTVGGKLDVRFTPTRPEPRQASSTPIDARNRERARAGLLELVKSLCRCLRPYKREDRETSNRVRPAEQLLATAQALADALKAEEETFLPTLLEDYIETLALGGCDDIEALEANDAALYRRVIKRGRQLYGFYPELAELSDPANTRFIPDDFPYTVAELSAELHGLAFSYDGRIVFTEQTRTLIEAEEKALVPKGANEEKTKLARLGAIAGEMRREMSKYADKAQKAIDRTASFLKSYEKLQKIWEKIEPFIGFGDGS